MQEAEISDIIKEIDEVTVLLYQQKNTEAYEKLDGLLVHLSNLLETMLNIFKESDFLEAFSKPMITMFSRAMNALEVRDTILLADILEYEIKGKLIEILNKG